MQIYKNILSLPQLLHNQMRVRVIFSLLTVIFYLSSARAQDVSYNAVYRVDGEDSSGETYRSHVNIESMNVDESAVLAENEAMLILTSVRVNKTGGVLSSVQLREQYGVNSAVLATGGSNVLIENPTVNVHVSQADAVTSQGAGTSVTVKGGQMSTGLRAVKGGLLTAEKTSVSTLGNHSPAVSASLPESRVVVNGLKGSTNGVSSPLFHVSGELSASGCFMESGASQISTVEGSGSLSIEDCEFMGGNYCGFLVFSSDARTGQAESNIALKGCRISVKDGPFIYATNTDVYVRMEKNSISNNSRILLRAQKDDWGKEGENGARVTIDAVKQKLDGDILIDDISAVRINLGKGSSLNGAVNPEANPGAEARLFISKGASWNPKDISYVTSVEFEEPVAKGIKRIKSRNDIVYDSGDPANSKLESKQYRLGGGGLLRPM